MKFIILALALFSGALFAQSRELSENYLIDRIKQSDNLSTMRARLGQRRASVEESRVGERYGWALVANSNLQRDFQKPSKAFQPVMDPVSSSQLQLQKGMAFGSRVAIGLDVDQRIMTDGSSKEHTAVGALARVEVDLWKNLLGAMESAQYAKVSLAAEQERLKARINEVTVVNSIRKLFWSAVANLESQKLTESLMAAARSQLAESEKRAKSFIAEKDEILRYKNQVAQYQSRLANLKYDKKIIDKQVQSMIPDVVSFVPGPYNMEQTVGEVMQCISTVKGFSQTPWEHTEWQAILALMSQAHQAQAAVTRHYAKPDLTLGVEGHYGGRDNSSSSAFDDLSSRGKWRYSLALKLMVPLGAPQKTRNLMSDLDRETSAMDLIEVKTNVDSHFSQILGQIDLLVRSMEIKNKNGEELQSLVAETKRKYTQARTTLDAVINDENLMAANALDRIGLKLVVIHTLLDFFSVFTKTPCSFNR